MTIMEAIQQVDALKPNAYSTRQKILWLSQLESMVQRLVIDVCSGEGTGGFSGFSGETDTATVLIMEEPFDMAYLYWLEAQIHYTNEEPDLYNGAMGMFQSVFNAYKYHYRRTNTGKKAGRFRF